VTEHRCVVCPQLRLGEPRHYERAHVCEGCRVRLAALLVEVRDNTALLPRELMPGASHEQRVSGSREAPLPFRVDALDLLMPAHAGTVHDVLGDQTGYLSVATVLDAWARDWCEVRDRGERRPLPVVVELVVWLGNRTEWACDRHPAVDEYAAELYELAGTLRAIVEPGPRPPERCKGVPCRVCDLLCLYRVTDGTGDVECKNPACRTVYRADEYHRWVALVAASARTPRMETAS
jgi:hypothetical protein